MQPLQVVIKSFDDMLDKMHNTRPPDDTVIMAGWLLCTILEVKWMFLGWNQHIKQGKNVSCKLMLVIITAQYFNLI